MEKLLTWKEFRENTYSFLNSAGMASNRLKDMEGRDRRRWHLADANNDDNLDREEFSAFLHPETEERMGEIVVTELMEDMDSDRAYLEKAANGANTIRKVLFRYAGSLKHLQSIVCELPFFQRVPMVLLV